MLPFFLRTATPSCSWPRSLLLLSQNYATASPNVQNPDLNRKDASSASPTRRLTVDPNHGLWHFFRKKDVNGEVVYHTVEPSRTDTLTGRSWTAAELRRKSFSDLHTLWYVVLRERNLLATQREEARRIGVPLPHLSVSMSRVHQCRKTMARIKGVLNERRLAYEGAVKLLSEKREEAKIKCELSAVDETTQTEDIAEQADMPRVTKSGAKVAPPPPPPPPASASLFASKQLDDRL